MVAAESNRWSVFAAAGKSRHLSFATQAFNEAFQR